MTLASIITQKELIADQNLMAISLIVYLSPFGETQTFRFLLVLRGAAIAIADKKRVNPVHPPTIIHKKSLIAFFSVTTTTIEGRTLFT
ncbi:MAG: hypothetical protein ACKOFS_01245, partial [Microcystis panniformis]